MVRRALEVATARAWTSADVSAGTPPPSLRRADAFVAVAERYLAGATAGPVVSEYGFRVESDGEGGFRFFRADGMKVEVSCAPPVLGMNPVDALRGRHHAAGIAIDAQAGFPHWDGRPPDYDQIVFCLTARQEDRPVVQ